MTNEFSVRDVVPIYEACTGRTCLCALSACAPGKSSSLQSTQDSYALHLTQDLRTKLACQSWCTCALSPHYLLFSSLSYVWGFQGISDAGCSQMYMKQASGCFSSDMLIILLDMEPSTGSPFRDQASTSLGQMLGHQIKVLVLLSDEETAKLLMLVLFFLISYNVLSG